MSDLRVQRLAQTLVGYSVNVQPGETVILQADTSALPLFEETYREVVRAGGHCIPYLTSGALDDFLLRRASDAQLTWISPLDKWIAEEAEVRIVIRSSSNTRRSTSLDPKRVQIMNAARRDLMKIRFDRAARGEQRWTLTLFPTDAYAQDAEMSLAEFEDFVYRATFADQPDPIARWKQLYADQQKYVDWIKGRKHVQVRGPNVDLTLSIEGRTFINSGGTHNMPSGEIFTGPVEDSVNGWVRFTYPAIRDGRQVDGIELHFENGKVVKASAAKNEDYLHTMLASDPGASYLGEFAIGTNFGIDRFIGQILFDEKIGGTFHMALGNGYPETGSKNESAIHWDIICDMRHGGEIVVDGDLFYKDGGFVI
ncbi:MAG TPA: aminopeptidase [Aggregatilineales bacterium]|nr:aminopeptidase [Aggregatilineales bacterium]